MRLKRKNMKPQTEEQIADGLRKIMDGKLILQKASKALDAQAAASAPGSQIEQTSLGLTRSLCHLGQAVADIPEELWAVMLGSLADVPLKQLEQSSKAA
jgi:hypothetical protein